MKVRDDKMPKYVYEKHLIASLSHSPRAVLLSKPSRH